MVLDISVVIVMHLESCAGSALSVELRMRWKLLLGIEQVELPSHQVG